MARHSGSNKNPAFLKFNKKILYFFFSSHMIILSPEMMMYNEEFSETNSHSCAWKFSSHISYELEYERNSA